MDDAAEGEVRCFEVFVDVITAQGDTPVLTDAEHYGMGTERPLAEYMKLTGIDVEHKRCPAVKWCNNEELL